MPDPDTVEREPLAKIRAIADLENVMERLGRAMKTIPETGMTLEEMQEQPGGAFAEALRQLRSCHAALGRAEAALRGDAALIVRCLDRVLGDHLGGEALPAPRSQLVDLRWKLRKLSTTEGDGDE